MDPLWIHDINVLTKSDSILDIWPDPDYHSYNERHNALARFLIIFCIISALTNESVRPIVFMLVMLLGLQLYLSSFPDDPPIELRKDIESKQAIIVNNNTMNATMNNTMNNMMVCKEPTLNNPMANMMVGDSLTMGACNMSIDSNHLLTQGIPKSEFDIYDRHHSERQFFTMPNNHSVNDQMAFANFLYGDI